MNFVKSFLRFFNHYSIAGNGQHLERARGQLGLIYLPQTYLAITLLLLSIQLNAQDVAKPSSWLERTDFKVGYFGNVIDNNGLNLGAEYRWRENIRSKERRGVQKTVKLQLLLNGSLGYSTNFATQTQNGIFTYSGLILRRVNTKNRELSIELNPLGLYRSVLPATYKVVSNDVNRVSLPGRSYYAPSVAIGIGRFRRAHKRSGWYLNLQHTLLINYNTGLLPIGSLHFGRKF
ncbi:MAG: hypothetical protein AAGJ93_01190 [Bacteroidota bacterium]